MRTLVREQMENVHPLTVPLLVEIGVGPNWRDLSNSRIGTRIREDLTLQRAFLIAPAIFSR